MPKNSLGIQPLLEKIIKQENDAKSPSEHWIDNQLEHDMKYQEKYLQEQDTEMGVSQSALEKYSPKASTISALLTVLSVLAISYGAMQGVDKIILGGADKNTQQQIIQDTQEDLQDAIVIDTAVINAYKNVLRADDLEEFEQLSVQEQREYAQYGDK